MTQEAKSTGLTVDSRGFVRAQGICLGKLTSDGQSIVVADRDRQRSQQRGTRYVVVPLQDLAKLIKTK